MSVSRLPPTVTTASTAARSSRAIVCTLDQSSLEGSSAGVVPLRWRGSLVMMGKPRIRVAFETRREAAERMGRRLSEKEATCTGSLVPFEKHVSNGQRTTDGSGSSSDSTSSRMTPEINFLAIFLIYSGLISVKSNVFYTCEKNWTGDRE